MVAVKKKKIYIYIYEKVILPTWDFFNSCSFIMFKFLLCVFKMIDIALSISHLNFLNFKK